MTELAVIEHGINSNQQDFVSVPQFNVTEYEVKNPATTKLSFKDKLQEVTASKTKSEFTWHKNFLVVIFPFVILGFPFHFLIGKASEERFTWKRWIIHNFVTSVLENPLILLFTVPLLVYTLVVSYFSLYEIWILFHQMIILGQFSFITLWQILRVIRVMPVYVPLILVWVYGHPLRNLITSFDIFRDDFKKYSGITSKKILASPPIATTIICVYLALFCIHLIPNFTDIFDGKDKLIHWADLTYSFVLPFYLMFVLAIKSQYRLMSHLMNTLVKQNERPDLETLLHVKYLYKRLVRQVVYVNEVFGLYLSWVIPAHAYTIGFRLFLMLMYILGALAFATLVSLLDPLDLSSPELVRNTIGNLFVTCLYIAIVGYTVWQAILTNDEARYSQVLLNDYLSDRDRDPPALLVQTDEVYKSARHLKFILQSTARQENPAMLRIFIVNFLPWINYRLHSPELFHMNVHGRFIRDVV